MAGLHEPVIDARPLQNEHRHRGIGRYVTGLIVALARSGQVHRLLVHGDRPLPEAVRAWPRAVSRRPHFLRYHFGWAVDELLVPMTMRARSWNSFHATDPDAVPDGNLISTIATIYDLTPLKDAAVWAGLTTDQRLGYRRMLANSRRADAIITISHVVADDIRRNLGVPGDRIQVVYPWIDAADWHVANPAAREGVLFVGAPGANKNVEGLLHALARIPPAPRLTVAGPWSRSVGEDMLELSRRLGVNATLEPYVTDERLRHLFATSALLVMPSREEGFGLPLLEAMASGCPAVVSDAPALVELSAGAARVTPRGDAVSLAAAIRELLADDEARAELSSRGRERAAAFSWRESLAALEAAYRRYA